MNERAITLTQAPVRLLLLVTVANGLACESDDCGWKGTQAEAAVDGACGRYICPECGTKVRCVVFHVPDEWIA